MLQDPGRDEVPEILEGDRLLIEGRVGGQDGGARIVESEQVLQLDAVERCFPRHHDQGPAFLEGHHGRPVDQGSAQAGGEGADRPHAGRHHGHPVHRKGPAGHPRSQVLIAMDHHLVRCRVQPVACGQGLDQPVPAPPQVPLFLEQAGAVARDDQFHAVPVLDERLEQTLRVEGPTGPGHGQNESLAAHNSTPAHAVRK